MENKVILINPFTVPVGRIEECIEYWDAVRNFMQAQQGYISTKLHRALQADATYQLINVAEWESMEAFFAANKKMREALGHIQIEGLVADPALYTVIRT
jgi:heme-degrading monooxygenase HmoA